MSAGAMKARQAGFARPARLVERHLRHQGPLQRHCISRERTLAVGQRNC